MIRNSEEALLHNIRVNPKDNHNKFPSSLQVALKKLKNNPNLVIMPADKNLGLVLLDRDWYLKEGDRQLADVNVYKQVDTVPFEELHSRLEHICYKYKNFISRDEIKYILHKPMNNYRVCALYFLPKLHKTPVVGRPICSYNGFIFEHTSIWLHHKLYPILQSQKQHLRDSLSLIRDIETLQLPPDTWLFTFDVESLYPSIPTAEGLDALRNMIKDHFSSGEVHLIMNLAALTLQQHFLEFDGRFWQQIKGTAMGSNFAVVYACLFLCFLENMQETKQELQYFKRYIDDALGFWHGNRHDLTVFLDSYAQGLKEHIKITRCVSQTEVIFLDVHIFKDTDFQKTHKLSTRCHQKELNRYQYLPYCSAHPKHQKEAFVTGELKRYVARESSIKSFKRIRLLFFQRLRARGYPTRFLRFCFSKVKYSMRNTLLLQKTNADNNKNPLVLKIFYSEYTRTLGLTKTLAQLYKEFEKDVELRHLPRPMVCWRNPRNLRSHLVSSRIKSLIWKFLSNLVFTLHIVKHNSRGITYKTLVEIVLTSHKCRKTLDKKRHRWVNTWDLVTKH